MNTITKRFRRVRDVKRSIVFAEVTDSGDVISQEARNWDDTVISQTIYVQKSVFGDTTPPDEIEVEVRW